MGHKTPKTRAVVQLARGVHLVIPERASAAWTITDPSGGSVQLTASARERLYDALYKDITAGARNLAAAPDYEIVGGPIEGPGVGESSGLGR